MNKENLIKFRCTEAEKKLIEKRADRSGLTVSAFCREQSLRGSVFATPKLTKQEVSFFKELTRFNTHWTRVGNLVKNSSPKLHHEIGQLLESSKKLIQKFY